MKSNENENEKVYHWSKLRGNPFLHSLTTNMFMNGEIKTIKGFLKTDKAQTKEILREEPKNLKILFDRSFVKAWIIQHSKRLGLKPDTFLEALRTILNEDD